MARVVNEERDRALVECAFCKGIGLDPFGIMSRLATCYACLGKKSHWVEKPLKECPYCHRTGVSPIGGRNYCLVCHGTGTVSITEPANKCSVCGGTGEDRHTGLYCWPCRGKGAMVSHA